LLPLGVILTLGESTHQIVCMDFETVEVMSTLDVTGVSRSLEQAAAKVKELAKVTGAQDVKASVEALAAQLKVVHGVVAKQHTEMLAAIQTVADVSGKVADVSAKTLAGQAQHNNMILAATQAQTHNQLAIRTREKMRNGAHHLSYIDKQLLVLSATKYGWKLGDKEKKRYNAELESDEEQIERRWQDALSTLEIVTIPRLTSGEAAYNTFVK
jgi:acetolactate synthase small subunit